MDTYPSNTLDLFSGYGGFQLGLRLAGIPIRTVCYVEWDKYCQQVLLQRFKDDPPTLTPAPVWDDIKSFDGRPWREVVDIITAGFPCQPHSNAGRRRGADDDRNLWPDTLRIIREVGPKRVILENVPGILMGSDGRQPYGGIVVGELADAGYDAVWRVVSAADAGAPHLRKRWWLVAQPTGYGCHNAKRGIISQDHRSTSPRSHAPQIV